MLCANSSGRKLSILAVLAIAVFAAMARADAAPNATAIAVLDRADALVPGPGCGGSLTQIALLPAACFTPARTLGYRGNATFWTPATQWLRFTAPEIARSGGSWVMRVPTYVTDGDLAVVGPRGQLIASAHFGATVPVAERAIVSHDVLVPLAAAPAGARFVVRETGPFSLPRGLRLIAATPDALALATLQGIGLPLAFFNGGALTMALFNLALFGLLRRRIYLLYAAAIAALVAFQVVSTGAAWTVLWPHASLRDDYPPYVAWLVYVVLIVMFTRSFLDLPRVSSRADRVLWIATAIVVVDSAIYVAVPDVLERTGLYAWVDPLATIFLVGGMLGAGIVALRRGVSGASAYIVAFAGSAIGILIGEVATYLPPPWSSREFAYLPTACGVAWESIFLALALGQRVSESERIVARFSEYAYRDSVTGIANRRAFDEAIEREWNRARRTGSSIAVIFFDIDHFKAFNDRYGHPAGDQRLVAVALAIAASARREGDLAARYGGEEFVVLLPNTTLEHAFAIAEEARERVAELSGDPPLTVSAGVAATIASEATSSPPALVRAADTALYAAKQAGRNRTERATQTASV